MLALVTAVVLVVVASASLGQDWLIGVSVPVAAFVSSVAIWAALVRRGWSWRDLGFVRASRSLWHLLWEVPLIWITAVLLTVLVGTWVGLDPAGTDSSTSTQADALQLGVAALLITAVCVTLLIPALEEIDLLPSRSLRLDGAASWCHAGRSRVSVGVRSGPHRATCCPAAFPHWARCGRVGAWTPNTVGVAGAACPQQRRRHRGCACGAALGSTHQERDPYERHKLPTIIWITVIANCAALAWLVNEAPVTLL